MTPMDPGLPQRRHPVHGIRFTRNAPTVVFLTVCTRTRQTWLANDACHTLLQAVWRSATAWRIGAYVLMPDHVHLFAVPGEPEVDLEHWVRFWKSSFSKAHQDHSRRWEPNHWDTRMRTREQYVEKLDYILHNPVRHGLAQSPDEWPFHGEIYPIVW